MAYKRDYKKEYENYDGTEKVKKRRAARNKARRYMERNGRVHKGDGKDVDHRKVLLHFTFNCTDGQNLF